MYENWSHNKLRLNLRISRLFLVTILSVPLVAWAEWIPASDSNEATTFLDPSSVRYDGVFRKVWTLQNLKQRHKDGELSRRMRDEYDCKQERSRVLSATFHSGPMATGEVLERLIEPGSWLDIVPSSHAAVIFKYLCTK